MVNGEGRRTSEWKWGRKRMRHGYEDANLSQKFLIFEFSVNNEEISKLLVQMRPKP